MNLRPPGFSVAKVIPGFLQYKEAESSLICPACKLRYPVRDDIPIMLLDEATPL